MKHQKKKIYKIPTVTGKEKKKRKVLDFLLFLFPFFLVFLIVKVFFIMGVVPSGSMLPLMHTDSAIIASRFSYLVTEPQRGDVIVFKKGDSVMTKRIIGIPGDNISIQNNLVYINQQPVVENYVLDGVPTEPLIEINYYEVPENSYFVLGDNRTDSNDSRNWKKPFVPENDIMGKVLCVFSVNPFSHGFYYRGVTTIHIEETYSNAPKYDANNIVVETANSPPEMEEQDTNSESSSPVSSTLPVATISPEVIIEAESTEEAEETLESNEKEGSSSDETLEDTLPEETTEDSTIESSQ